jgi:4,5-dihydroxyphthalate decarboxylase
MVLSPSIQPRAFKAPADLRGKRVGGPTFLAAGNVWMRGILEEHHGVPHRDITWVVEREDAVAFTPPPGLRIETTAAGVRAEMLISAAPSMPYLSPDLLQSLMQGDKRMARLFTDSKAAEIAYFRTTGIFPIRHVTVIKREILERNPWVANNLMKAFAAAKELAYRRIANPRNVALAWVRNAVEEQLELMGPDP